MTEAFLQYVWQHNLLEGPLYTTEGQSVVVERAGELNRDAGPDFIDARVEIEGIRWAGNVEVHIKSSDWNIHRHSSDKNYNNVVLHVVYVHDTDIVTESGKPVATVVIADAIPEHIWENYDQLMNAAADCAIPCARRLAEIPDMLFRISQDRLIVERMERKSVDAERILHETKGGWEQACYRLTARYFGGRTNAFAFELLAKTTPMGIVAKIKDKPFRVEALYFGQAGMLEGEFKDDYPKALQQEYRYLSAAYNLTPMAGHLWKFFRVRPAGFPTLRISQFANLMAGDDNLFSRMLETPDPVLLRSIFKVEASEYWTTHYRFDKEAPRRVKPLGKGEVETILVNAWIPLLFEYGVMHGDEDKKEQAFELLRQLPPEDNRIVRLWENEGVAPENAADTQALIQRYNEYCSRKRCLECQIAFRLITK